MSIPKEPRQLMINIMYLVLTAMLALNVSAEVMNAFFTLDEGNKSAINTVNSQVDATQEAVNDLLSDESKAKFQPIAPAIEQVRSISARFNDEINDLRDFLIDQSGNRDGKHVENDPGDYIMYHGHYVIKGKKDKDVTTRVLVDGWEADGQKHEPRGPELYENIENTREELIEAYSVLLNDHYETFGRTEEDVQTLINSVGINMPFGVEESEVWEEAKAPSWESWKFRQMPLAAVLPLLSQMQSDLKTSEAAMVNSMAELAGGRNIVFDAFFPVVQADRAYVIGGEQFTAKISVGSYSSSLQPENVRLSVNGTNLSINEDGSADYSVRASGLGPKTLNLAVAVTNPLTGEVTEGDGTYTYEVGARSCAVSADKMNVFYVGVDNPITISAAGVNSADVRVSASGVNMSGSGSTRVITASTPTNDASITVSAGGQNLGTFPFRVKRIPNPTAMLGNASDGSMGTGEFKAQRGIRAVLDNFDFDARCDIVGFELVYVPKREDAVPSNNAGPVYTERSNNLVNRARPGDTYYFNNVRAKCPGDPASRKINAMVFTIR